MESKNVKISSLPPYLYLFIHPAEPIIEQDGTAAIPQTHIREVLGSNL
jgi:hypothetical protein